MFQLVMAVTLASVLSHISMLLILGRGEELSRGMDMLTDAINYETVDQRLVGEHQQQAYLPYPAYERRPIPQAVPAGHSTWGAPLDWHNPAQGEQSAGRHGPKPQSTMTNNYYM